MTPTLTQFLQAAPRLHWRKCWHCAETAVHVDDVMPWVTCQRCGSHDTRPLPALTQAMREAAMNLTPAQIEDLKDRPGSEPSDETQRVVEARIAALRERKDRELGITEVKQ